jgi:hypothetical protein
VQRATRLGASLTPLLIVHRPAHRAKVAIADALYVTIGRNAPNEIALDLARTSRPIEKLSLCFGRRCPIVDRIDPGCHESPIDPGPVLRIDVARGTLGEFSAPALDPPIVVLRSPSTPVSCLVRRGPTHRLLGLAHLRSVDQVLQGFAADAELVLRLDRERRRLGSADALQSTRFVCRSQRCLDAPELVLQITSLSELPLGLLKLDV